MAKKKKNKQKLTWLAHFAERGGQVIIASNRDDAIKRGEAAARRIGTTLADITGPDEDIADSNVD
jgi:hypothetical protein